MLGTYLGWKKEKFKSPSFTILISLVIARIPKNTSYFIHLPKVLSYDDIFNSMKSLLLLIPINLMLQHVLLNISLLMFFCSNPRTKTYKIGWMKNGQELNISH